MTIKDFVNEAKREVRDYFFRCGMEDMLVDSTEIVKTNDNRMHGLMLRREGSTTGANVYVDDLFERHEAGEDMDELMDELFGQCEYAALFPVPDVPEGPELRFENIRDRLSLRLLDVRNNVSYMSDRPYIDAGSGLALIAYISPEDPALSEWKLAVTESLLDTIGTDGETLLTAAMENTIENEPPVLFSLGELEDGRGCRNLLVDHSEDDSFKYAYALTNRSRFHGAAALFYPDVMARAGSIIDDDYYVIPSSAHEVILIPDSLSVPVEHLKSMVKHANEAMPQEDRLSYNVFHYSRSIDRLNIATS